MWVYEVEFHTTGPGLEMTRWLVHGYVDAVRLDRVVEYDWPERRVTV